MTRPILINNNGKQRLRQLGRVIVIDLAGHFCLAAASVHVVTVQDDDLGGAGQGGVRVERLGRDLEVAPPYRGPVDAGDALARTLTLLVFTLGCGRTEVGRLVVLHLVQLDHGVADVRLRSALGVFAPAPDRAQRVLLAVAEDEVLPAQRVGGDTFGCGLGCLDDMC